MTVKVLIVNHDCSALTNSCITSIREHCKLNKDFYVADNGLENQTIQIQSEHAYARVFRLEENRGFGHAINTLINKIDAQPSEYLLIINPDTYCSQDFLSPLVEAMENNHELAAATPTILTQDDHIWYAGGYINLLKGGPVHNKQVKSREITEVDFISGCAFLTRFETLQKAGGLQEGYFLYFEDADLCKTWKSMGLILAWVPSAKVYHHVSATTDSRSTLYAYLFARNRIWFARKFSKTSEYLVFLFLHLTIRTPAAIAYFLTTHGQDHCKAFFQGLRDGLKKELTNVSTIHETRHIHS